MEETVFDPSTHPHRRYNPLTQEYVLVSPHRTKRPWQGQTEPPPSTSLPKYDPKCYLCPGNSRSGGQLTPAYSGTYVFENDFPAVLPPPAPQAPEAPHPLLTSAPIHGACDVLVFHPRHDLTLARLSLEDIGRVIDEWTAVYRLRSEQAGTQYVQIFENKGALMGCSNPHPHGQVWSLSTVPSLASKELASLLAYANKTHSPSTAPQDQHGRDHLLLEYAHFEVGGIRVVVHNADWLAIVPWWATWPFEILLLPYKRQIPSLVELRPEEKVTLADALSKVTTRYDNLFKTSFAYSMGIHQRPTAKANSQPDDHDIAHLHFHFYPPLLRSASVRKFLVGFELMGEAQRDLTPEQAAQMLRDCSDVHYLQSE